MGTDALITTSGDDALKNSEAVRASVAPNAVSIRQSDRLTEVRGIAKHLTLLWRNWAVPQIGFADGTVEWCGHGTPGQNRT